MSQRESIDKDYMEQHIDCLRAVLSESQSVKVFIFKIQTLVPLEAVPVILTTFSPSSGRFGST